MSGPLPKLRSKRSSTVPRGDGHVRRVLLLDDHQGSRIATHYGITALGYDCKAVGSVDALFTAFASYQPDAIIYEWSCRSDSRDGLGARLRAHAADRRLHIAVIILSALDEPRGFRQREEVDAYLTKPFQNAELKTVLEAWIG